MISVILLSEVLKLLFSIILYFCFQKTASIRNLIYDLKSNGKTCFFYMIPALLYCLYNNLSYVNLQSYDPATYMILLQFRNVITGFCYQCLFRRRLSGLQWISLSILTFSCIIKQSGSISFEDLNSSSLSFSSILLMFAQILSSCFAGVYNEYLLKDISISVNIYVQNMFMYIDSIFCNFVLLLFSSNNSENSNLNLSFLQQPIVLLILINGAFAGITTSFFLKNFNSILKTFAITIEIMASAIISSFLFSTPLDQYMIASIVLIVIAMFCYAMAPVACDTVTNINNNNIDMLIHKKKHFSGSC